MRKFRKSIAQTITALSITVLMSCASTPKNEKTSENLYFPPFETEDGKILFEYDAEKDTVFMPFQLFKNIVLYIDMLNE